MIEPSGFQQFLELAGQSPIMFIGFFIWKCYSALNTIVENTRNIKDDNDQIKREILTITSMLRAKEY